MNLSEIQAEVGRLLNDPNNQRWGADVITSRANLAQTIVQAYTNAVKTKETLTATLSTAEVTVDADTMDIIRVRITRQNGAKERLEGITREELDFRFPDWENLGDGAPQMYWFDATNRNINLVPKPDAANVISNGIEVWEVLKPADLASASDIPFDSNVPMIPYTMSIVHWVVSQCWMDDGTPEALSKSKFHKSGMLERPGEFEKQILLINEKFDVPTDIPARVLWRPQGARLNRGFSQPTKSYPFR